MEIEIVYERICGAYLFLSLMRCADPQKQQTLEELQMRMARIKEDFGELFA